MGDGLRFLSELYFVFIFLFLAFCGKKNDTGLFGMSVSKQTKGIAAVLIMVGHSVSATTIDTIQFLNVGWYGVAVFFLWSGYGVAYGYNNKKDYLKGFLIKRGIKIGVPFLLAHLIYIPIKIACGMHYSSRDYILSLFGGGIIVDNSWYPAAVFIFYIVFEICFRLNIKTKHKLALLSVCVIGVTVVESIVFTENSNWWVISNLAFIIGVYSACYDISKYKKTIVVFSVLAVFGIGYVLFPISRKIIGTTFSMRVLSDNLMSGALSFLVVYLYGCIGRKNRVCSFLGEISYEIYLLHGLFIFLFANVLKCTNILLVFLTVVCTIPASILLKRIDGFVLNKFLQLVSHKR